MAKLSNIIGDIVQTEMMKQLFLSEEKEAGRTRAGRMMKAQGLDLKSKKDAAAKTSADKPADPAVELARAEKERRKAKDAEKIAAAKSEFDAQDKAPKTTKTGKVKIAKDLYKDEPEEPVKRTKRRGDEDSSDDDSGSDSLKESHVQELRDAVRMLVAARTEK